MPLHDFWPFNHVPASTTDLSTGSGGPVYATKTGTYYQYTGNPGYAYGNGIAGAITVGSDAYLKLQSNTTSNPGLAVQAKEVQDWVTATQYWIGFRTKTSVQNTATANVFAMADTIGQTNVLAFLKESDMTAAGASTLNQEYMVEVFIDRVAKTYEVWIAGVKYSSGSIAAAVLANLGNSFYWFGPWNSGTTPPSANRSYRDFYWVDVDAVQTPKRLGSMRTTAAPNTGVSAPNWLFQTATLSGTAALSSAQAKWGTQSLTMGATNSAATCALVPDAPWNRFGTYGDCTLEAWVYPLNTTQNGVIFAHDTGSSPYAQIALNAGNVTAALDSASSNISGASSWTANTWNHLALVRNNGIWYLYSNGVKVGQVTGGTFGNIAAPFRIGNWNGANAFQGYIDSVRISNVARYPAGTTFTPPSAEFVPDANTLMLLKFEPNTSAVLHDSATPELAAPSNLGFGGSGSVLSTQPALLSPASLDTLTESFGSTVLANSKIVAVDYRLAGQAGSPGETLSPVITDGTNNATQSQIALPVGTMNLGQRLALRSAAPDGGIWTPAKVTAAQLKLTPAQVKTMLLLHFDGANGSTSFTDATGFSSPSAAGTAALSTTQSKFGGSSLVAGTGAASVPNSSFVQGLGLSGDCTIEFWCMSSNNSQNGCPFGKDVSGGSTYSELQYYQGAWRLYLDSASYAFNLSSGVAVNTWMHIAVVKYNGVWTLYQNGVALGTSTGGTLGNNTNPFVVGNWGGLSAPWQGFIDEFRISSVARYTAAFTPPAAAFSLD